MASLQRLARRRGLTIQAQMTVTAAGDQYEQEADAVASRIVERLQTPSSPPSPSDNGVQRQEEDEELQPKPLADNISRLQRQEMEEEELQMQRQEAEEEELQMQRQEEDEELQMQRQTEEEEELQAQRQEEEEEELQMQRQEEDEELQMQRQAEEEEELQAKAAPIGREGGAVDAATEQTIRQARGNGQRMASSVRQPMERAFGADFGSVRLHTGSQSDRLNRAISARAFTTGSDIFFRQGAYEPHSRSGQQLLAHELTHVVQQGSAPRRTVQREGDEDQEGVEGSDNATRTFKLQELSYRGFSLFLRQILGLSDPTAVASLSVSFTFKIGVGAGIPNIIGASISPYITLGGTINVADDRRLRVGASLEFGAESELNILKLWKIHAKIGMQLGIAGAFEDERHLAAFVISRIAKLLKGFKRLIMGRARDRRRQLTREEIAAINQIGLPGDSEEGYEELSQKGVSVRAHKRGLTAEVGTELGEEVFKGSFSATRTRTTFFKNNSEGKRVKKTGDTLTEVFKLSLNIPLRPEKSVGFEVTITRTVITDDANPDNDGDYLNIKIGLSIPLGKPLLEQALQNAPAVFAGEDLEEVSKRFIRSLFDPVNLGALSGGFDPETPALEFNLVSRVPPDEGKGFFKQLKDGDYFLQYARLTRNFSKEVEGKQEIPTPVPGLNVTLGQKLTFERSVGTGEYLGGKTLTYIQTVYNGLLNRGRRGQNQWNQYREAHKHQIYQMFIAVADPDTAAHQEASGLDTSDVANQLDNETVRKANAFVGTCQASFSKEKMARYDMENDSDRRLLKALQKNVMPYFEAYLAAARAAGKHDDAKTWRLVRSGYARAEVHDNQRPFKPQLTKLKFDKGVQDDMDPEFPRTLRESYEEGFRHQIKFKGRHVGSGKTKTISVNFQQPDDPAQKFAQKVGSSSLRKFTKFPMGLTILEEEFSKHADAAQNKFDSVYRRRVTSAEMYTKAIKVAQEERQTFWEKKLYHHLAEVMETTLDNELERKSS
ncbi:MAG TPA: DUF4157 domain-containing protein [Candidatus Sulfomarinibacteraceae bacterium]|nr:DUF4157 domain-containing protein [Candidatus Sulfomarinibacteraceae bacterium]